jgi:hypothetical protein
MSTRLPNVDDSASTGRRGWTGPAGVVVLGLGAAGAVYGWVRLEQTAEVGPGVLWYGAAMALAFAGNALLRALSERDGISATGRRILAVRRSDPFRVQLQAWSVPGRLTLLLPVLLLPALLALLPIAFAHSPGDASIIAVALVFTALLGPLGLLAGFLVWGCVVLPLLLVLRVLARLVTRQRASDNDLAALGLGALLVSITIFAVTLVAAAPDTAERSTRTANQNQFTALIGLDTSHVEHPALVWMARLALAAIVASVVLLMRVIGKGKPAR